MTEKPNKNKEEPSSDATAGDDIDEDLLALPPPPPNPRLLIFVATILVLSGVMMVWFYPELHYFLAAFKSPVKLGEAADINPKELTPDTLAEVEGFPLIQRTLTYKEGVKWFMMSDNTRKFFPLAGQPHLYVQWAETAEHKAYRDPETAPGVLGPPSKFRGHLTTREALGPNYDRVWVFYDCLKYHYLGRCNRCLGLNSLSDCRDAFVCAEQNDPEMCKEILAGTDNGETSELREIRIATRAVRLEELSILAGRLHAEAVRQKSPDEATVRKTREDILRLRINELRIRAVDALRTVAVLKDDDKARLRALRKELTDTQKKEESLVSELTTMKVLVQMGDGIHRWKKRTAAILEEAGLLSATTVARATTIEPDTKDGGKLVHLLSALESEIAEAKRARRAASTPQCEGDACDKERDTETEEAAAVDTEPEPATDADVAAEANTGNEAIATKGTPKALPCGDGNCPPVDPDLATRLTAIKSRLRKMEMRLGEVLPGRLPELEKWALRPDILGNVPDALMETRVLTNIAEIERMTAAVPAAGDVDDEPEFALARQMNADIDRLTALRKRIKEIPETAGYFELAVADQLADLEGLLKAELPLPKADNVSREMDRLIAEMSTHKLYLFNLKGSPDQMKQLDALVAESTLAPMEQTLSSAASKLIPGDFVLIDGEIPMDKIWVVLVYLALIAMTVINIRKIKRFIDAYRK